MFSSYDGETMPSLWSFSLTGCSFLITFFCLFLIYQAMVGKPWTPAYISSLLPAYSTPLNRIQSQGFKVKL